VFTTRVGTPLDTHNVRRDFRKVAEAAGLVAGEWTPRELRHSFVSLLSDDGMPIEHIARLVGHTSTAVTETVYRQQIRPVIVGGAEAMDRIFRESATASGPIVTQLEIMRRLRGATVGHETGSLPAWPGCGSQVAGSFAGDRAAVTGPGGAQLC
jgi:hypothetical protein